MLLNEQECFHSQPTINKQYYIYFIVIYIIITKFSDPSLKPPFQSLVFFLRNSGTHHFLDDMAVNVGKAAPDAVVQAMPGYFDCPPHYLQTSLLANTPDRNFLSKRESLNDRQRLNAWENRNNGVTVMGGSDR